MTIKLPLVKIQGVFTIYYPFYPFPTGYDHITLEDTVVLILDGNSEIVAHVEGTISV